MRILNLPIVLALTAFFPLLAISPANAADMPRHTLHVRVIDLRNSRGKQVCTLFDSSGISAFPDDDSKAFRTVTAPVQFGAATCDFSGLPKGEYAIVTFHDENENGQFDRDALGLPEEEYGFSNSLKPKFARPSFKQAAFIYDGGDQWLTIRIAN